MSASLSAWLDEPNLPYARCSEYDEVAECVGTRRPLSFCIDRLESHRSRRHFAKNHMRLRDR